MKTFKRWTTCIASGFESVINQVENHESVVTNSIRDLQEAAARAKVKVNRLKRDLANMRSKSAELELNRDLWNQRALKLRDSDKPKALECLRRRKRVEAELERLQAEIPQHATLADQIEADVSKLEGRIEELKRKKRAFSSRSCRAKALEISGSIDDLNGSDLEDTFERWEIKLAESEICAHVATDSLETQLQREEETAELEAELDALSDKTTDTP